MLHLPERRIRIFVWVWRNSTVARKLVTVPGGAAVQQHVTHTQMIPHKGAFSNLIETAGVVLLQTILLPRLGVASVALVPVIKQS